MGSDYGSPIGGFLAGGFGLFWVGLVIVIAVLWICVPFIIMGTNRRIEALLGRIDRIGRVLDSIADNQERTADALDAMAGRPPQRPTS